VHHRISTVAFPQSDCRAEIGVKTAKRLQTSIGPMENSTLTNFNVPFCSIGMLLIRTQKCRLQWYSLNIGFVMFIRPKF